MSDNNRSMYRAVHYDKRKELVFLWYTDGSREGYKASHKFYTPIPGEYGAIDSGMVDIYGKPMYACITDSETELETRYRHEGPNNYLSELDIDFRTRFLENHYKTVDDFRFTINDFNICYIDIEVESGDKFPSPKTADRRVNCVTLYLSQEKKYITFGLQKYLKPETVEKLKSINCEYFRFDSEAELITSLFKTIGSSDVDILTGWNSDGYDIPYLVKRAAGYEIPLRFLSRLPNEYKSAYINKRDNTLKIGGTEVVDYLPLYKKLTRGELDNYKLDSVAYIELKQRKAPLPDGYKSYINYWDEYVYYNVTDVKLLVDIDAKRRMMESLIAACSEARVPFGHFFESKKMLVGFILSFLHKRNIVMPPLKKNEGKKFPGAVVYSTPGYYKDLVSYDYRSMYPSIMMGANISPEMKVTYPIDYVVPEEELKNLVRSPWTAWGTKQIFYKKDTVGIVPAVVQILFDGRTDLKKKGKIAEKEGRYDDSVFYDMKQNAYKILGNALYGLLGNAHFQFYDLDNAANVTTYGYLLITKTTDKLNHYIKKEMTNTPEYKELFGDSTVLNTAYEKETRFERPAGDEFFVVSDRFSHGDTDSFFVKFDDLAKEFKKNIDKKVSVVVFDKNKLIYRKDYDLSSGEQDSKIDFNSKCSEYNPSWKEMKSDDKLKAFKDGLVSSGKIRVIYNRFNLTDYCRLLDSYIMESKLESIMQDYSDEWKFMENTLYLKREKCITEAIVTKKKKYICNIESNEDSRVLEKSSPFNPSSKMGVTGIEIVRSSTPPFARERIESIVIDLLKDLDKKKIRDRYMDIKKDFFKLVKANDVYAISIPSGIKTDPPTFSEYKTFPEEIRKKVDWRVRAAMVWNNLIDTDPELSKMTLEPISEGSKVKFLKVHKNIYNINTIAFIGDACPLPLLRHFNVDWDSQWESGFAKVIGRLFEAVGWESNLENDRVDEMAELF